MTTKISQKEYLKKYLSGGSHKKKKKKEKKAKVKSSTVKIIDDDVHVDDGLEIDEELLLTGEDAPQIVGIFDATEQNGKSKWKSIGATEPEQEQTVVRTFNDDDRWGKKATSICFEKLPALRNSPNRSSNIDDQSPPRRQRDVGQGRRHFQSRQTNEDQSPPRKRSPARVRRDSDQSPRRRPSPPHRRRNSDQSPVRRRSPARKRKVSDQSPPRRRRNSDQSPPRASKKRRDSDQSPRRRRSPGRHSDRSLSRHSSKHNRDQSPVRIKREPSSDQSPPRRHTNGNPFKVPAKVENPSSDNSPQRHRPHHDSVQSPARIKHERQSDSPPPSHKRVGLQNAKTLELEAEERRRKEDELFKQMPSELTGRNAEVQVRQNSAYRRRRRRDEEDDDPEVARKKAEHEEKKKELYERWNRGVKQLEDFKARVNEEQHESNKPLARYSDDADLEEMLRQKERAEDPMLEYIRSKRREQQGAVPEIPQYKGLYPENRFNIKPGYRWDGVDRSNGYESKWFKAQSEKTAMVDDAYKYSTEDM